MTKPASFGGHLRQFREAAGMTQEQLAVAVGLSELAVIRYESGQRIPAGWDVVLKLCEVLGKQPDDFASIRLRRKKKKQK